MPTIRVEITAETVKTASGMAAKRADGVNVWADIKQHYLSIRQRGPAVDWIVRTRGKTRVIGDVRERRQGFLSVRAARDQAASLYGQIAAGDDPNAGQSRSGGWTWGDLDREYQAMIAQPRWINRRMKPASKGTADDVRLAFAKPSLQALRGRRLTAVDRDAVDKALRKIARHRQREKCAAYVKAAFNWACEKRAGESGLAEDLAPWWHKLSAGDPDPEQMHAIETRRALHRQRKADLEIGHIGALLAWHEAYCAGRTAEEKISPGIRWGPWWFCLTANRRFSTVKLRRHDFMARDEFADADLGRAMWPPDTMKAKAAFWLPLPPVVRDVAIGSMTDWRQLVANEGKAPILTEWVFASTQRRDGADQKDVSVYPNSLNRHLLRMRATKALDGLPYFSLHLARTVMGNFLATKVSPVSASLVLAHTLPQTADEAAPTTRAYYLTSQRMAEKAAAMTAWSEALVEAYLKAGGKMPRPVEGPRLSKLKPPAG